MKSFIIYVLLALVIALGWYAYQQGQVNWEAEQQITQLENTVAELESQLINLKDEVNQLESQTVEGVMEDAGARLRDGLKAMIETAEDEFDKLQQVLDQVLEDLENPEQQTPPPPAEEKQTHQT